MSQPNVFTIQLIFIVMPQLIPFYFIDINNHINDFFSIITNLSYIYLYPLFVIAILILITICLKNTVKIGRVEKAKMIEEWEPLSIPKERKHDIFYLKLSYQFLIGLTASNPKSVYDRDHGWGKLTEEDINRLHRAAYLAESSGALSRTGYAINPNFRRPIYKEKIVLANKKHYMARSNVKFIKMIHKHDIEAGRQLM